MKLEFSLLVIDDMPSSTSQAVGILQDYLDDKGFDLAAEYPDDLSLATVDQLSRYGGRNYDLVAVDYNLGQEGFDGGDVASILRLELRYTDMVFYSSNASLDLHGRLAEAKVAGVFVATRDELDDALIGLADTVIGKAVDLNHMRGIAMAEIAEMDVMMEDALADAFLTASGTLTDTAARTVDKVKKSMAESSDRIEKVVSEHGIVGLVRSARLFSSAHKYHAIRRLCKRMSLQPTEHLDVLSSYEMVVIQNRNMLAHAKEIVTDGNTTLQSARRDGSFVLIDDEWMVGFRRALRTHRSALQAVCAAVREHFSS